MRILSIDPGITTGVALYDVYTNSVYVTQTTIPDELIAIIDKNLAPSDIVLIENFIGGGYRTSESTYTLKLLGFVEYYSYYVKRIRTFIQTPQTRKAYVGIARDILEQTTRTPHSIDAFAHILAYMAKEKIVSEPDFRSIKVCQV